MDFQIKAFGDSAVLIQFSDEISERVHHQVMAIVKSIDQLDLDGITAVVPSYNAVTVQYDYTQISYSTLLEELQQINIEESVEMVPKNIVHIPVCYHASLGVDLQEVCDVTGLNESELIAIHSSQNYLVYMMGFTPGFFYLGGLDERIHCPRKETPRVKIPKGAVGIGGAQTGVYTVASPGGWQIIGSTPLQIFDKNSDDKFKVKVGDLVKFYQISLEAYNNWSHD